MGESATPAEQITKASKSNLALAFFSLPRQKRRDITTFYAFCREIDDIGDEPGMDPEARHQGLELWGRALKQEQPGESLIAAPMRSLLARYEIDPMLTREIIEGVRMDVAGTRYSTMEDLRVYCWRVASAVGLVSIEIFGYRNSLCRDYAESLGLALQLTNILRDVAIDYRNGGRIYLPLEDLAAHGITEAQLRDEKPGTGFLPLMRFEAERAETFFRQARSKLPREDRRSMVAAEIMREVYSKLLRQMRADGFRVFEKRYGLNRVEKTTAIAGAMMGHWFGARR